VQFLSASYAQTLALRDSVKNRRLIESPWYKKIWGDRFSMTSDVNTKGRFENNKGGYRLATSVDGALTGEGGQIILIDDAHNATEVESELVRASTIMWWDEAMSTRLNDPATGAYVIVMQRLHQEDLTGHIISKEMNDWTWLMLPMEYDSYRHCATMINGVTFWEDPRTEENELLCPVRFPLEQVASLKARLGPFAAAGQLQQSPSPRGGGIIKDEWWQPWEEDQYPVFEYLIGSLDTAYTTKEENDPSALTVWGVFRDQKSGNMKIMLVWAWQGRLEIHDLIEEILMTCTTGPVSRERAEKHGEKPRLPLHLLLIEAKAAGLSVGQELYRMLAGNASFGIQFPNMNKGRFTQDKVARLYSVQHVFSDKMVYAPPRAFADMVIEQVSSFPKGTHDDLVDTVSQALRYLRDSGMLVRREEQALALSDSMQYHSREIPLYPV
jgi:predicted phage terminase large subunit-like protein